MKQLGWLYQPLPRLPVVAGTPAFYWDIEIVSRVEDLFAWIRIARCSPFSLECDLGKDAAYIVTESTSFDIDRVIRNLGQREWIGGFYG